MLPFMHYKPIGLIFGNRIFLSNELGYMGWNNFRKSNFYLKTLLF